MAYSFPRDAVVATLPIGYGHGFPKRLRCVNKHCAVNEGLCPTLLLDACIDWMPCNKVLLVFMMILFELEGFTCVRKQAARLLGRQLKIRSFSSEMCARVGSCDSLRNATSSRVYLCVYVCRVGSSTSDAWATHSEVLIHGVRCPIIGRISSSMTNIDVSAVPGGVRIGDEVTLMGVEPGGPTAEDHARRLGTSFDDVTANINGYSLHYLP